MDGRKTLAILKAMGLKNNEVAGVMVTESLVAPIVGIILGVMLGWGALVVMAHNGTGLIFTWTIVLSAIGSIMPALLVGTFIPSRFAQVATVIALMLERSIPLFCDRVKTISQLYPQLEEHRAKGVHFLKLDIIDGVFDGFIFRHQGDTVKRGEVIAHGSTWWGLKFREYVAPIDGTVMLFQKDTGFIGIAPIES